MTIKPSPILNSSALTRPILDTKRSTLLSLSVVYGLLVHLTRPALAGWHLCAESKTKSRRGGLLLSFLFLLLVTPSLGQTSATDYDQKFTSKTEVIDSSTPTVMHGYIFQTMTTPESYVLTNSDELKEFVATLPPYIPYKILPAPVNKDPFLHGFSVDFDQEIIAVAVGRDRISDNPSFLEADYSDDGWREIYFSLTAKTSVPYPYGWAVYSAIVLPRSESPTRVKMITIPAAPAPKPHKNSHPNRSFLDRAKKF